MVVMVRLFHTQKTRQDHCFQCSLVNRTIATICRIHIRIRRRIRASLPFFCRLSLRYVIAHSSDGWVACFSIGGRDSQITRKWHAQKLQDAFRDGVVGRHNIFVKENQRLNLIFTKIICPAWFMSRNAVTPFVNYLEIKLQSGPRLRSAALLSSPNARLTCYRPRNRLLHLVPSPHPNVSRLVESSG